MPLKFYLLILSLLYFTYLVGPVWRDPLRRNYLKLYRDTRYLVINLVISIALLTANIPFSSLPLIFILMALLANKISWLYYARDFVFIQRGDWAKGRPIDYVLSILLLVLSVAASLAVMIIFKQELSIK